MIGILFIYWIWKAFSNLALSYSKNKWRYFFIGLGSYFFSVFFSAICLVVIMGLIKGFDVVANEDFDTAGFNFIYVFFGGLGCYGTYKFLENRAEKKLDLAEDGIENIGLVDEN